jgi:hypothetical protein
MKKLFVILGACALVATFAAQSIGADWNLYGNVRMGLWRYDNEPGGNASDNQYTRLRLNDNSRIGAKIKNKANKLSGQLELGIQKEHEQTAPSATNDNKVTVRVWSAKWDFGGGKLMIGHDYTPIRGGTTSMAGQPSFERWDEALAYWGPYYDGRQGQIRLELGNFQVALVHSDDVHNLMTAGNVAEITIPKIAASYTFKLDPLTLKIMGSYLAYDIVRPGATELDVDAYGGGLHAKLNVGPVLLQGVGMWAQNANEMGLAARTDTRVTLNATGNNVVDNETLGFNVSALYTLSDMVQFGAGYGYSETESETAGSNPNEDTILYVQAVITLSPGVFIVPEFGINDRKNSGTVGPATAANVDADQGDKTYYGMKFQINF